MSLAVSFLMIDVEEIEQILLTAGVSVVRRWGGILNSGNWSRLGLGESIGARDRSGSKGIRLRSRSVL